MGNISFGLLLASFLFVVAAFGQFCWKEERIPVSKSNTTDADKYVECSYRCNSQLHKKQLSCPQNDCYIDYEVTRKEVCCDGYYKSGKDCIPVCRGGCQNGRCTSPETCTCNNGYLMVKGTCTPQCTNCANGNCVSPNQCICSDGFVKNNAGLCVSKCKEVCINGICNEFNKCVCREGFYFNEKLLEFGFRNITVCTAKCDKQCINGDCISPGKCSCWKGYRSTTESHICVPQCDPPCQNGICVGTNHCSCAEGYRKINATLCEPFCDPAKIDCSNGICVAPNTCHCNESYKLKNSKCVPECNPKCSNGYCTGPGECTCFRGFHRGNKPHICEPQCDSPCQNGVCTGFNECSCYVGYQKVNNTYCEPVCDSRYINAKNGTCIAPNLLRCDESFTQQETPDHKLSCVINCTYPCCGFEGICSIIRKHANIVAFVLGCIFVAIIASFVVCKLQSKSSKRKNSRCNEDASVAETTLITAPLISFQF